MSAHSYIIFRFLDEPKKYSGLTLAEISTVGGIFFIGAASDHMVIGLIACTVGLKLMRSILRSAYLIHWKRWCRFQLEELQLMQSGRGRFYV
jgi:hypothetical protein